MSKPDFIDACDAIVEYLKAGTYTGPIVPKEEIRRDYLPRFADPDMGKLQIVVGPDLMSVMIDNRCRRRTDETRIAIHILRQFGTIAEVDGLAWLTNDILDLMTVPDQKFGCLTVLAVDYEELFNRANYEQNRAWYAVPVFQMR